jgi:TetR/AcrR family transcriptional regulator
MGVKLKSPAKQAAKREANEARILEAAESIFAERGYGGATTSAIAEAAKLPKANIHYYFGTKRQLYREVLDNILNLWLAPMDDIQIEADPAEALAAYVKSKMWYSRNRPSASKVFANELLHGAPQIADYLSGHLRDVVDEKAAVLSQWIKQGRIAEVNPVHLFFVIWASTQTYADFDVQVSAVLGKTRLVKADYVRAEETVTRMVLAMCGLT